jgi:hypothetical protein
MLLRSWDIRFVNRNTENLSEAEIATDMVMTGGMLLQQADTLETITLVHKHGKQTHPSCRDGSASRR